MKPSRHEIIQTLAERIREIETRGEGPRTKAPGQKPEAETTFSSLVLGPSSLIEMVSLHEGDGAGTLALWLARQACPAGKAMVIADGEGTFYPPGAAVLGDDWDSCIIVRPKTLREVYLAAEYSLRCPAVGAVVVRPPPLSRSAMRDKSEASMARRLQAAAELGGGVGIILRPATALGTPVFATVRLLVRPLSGDDAAIISPLPLGEKGRGEGEMASLALDFAPHPQPLSPKGRGEQRPISSNGRRENHLHKQQRNEMFTLQSTDMPHLRRLQVEVVHRRGGVAGQSFVLELDHETGDVHLSAGVAAATARPRAAGASG